MDSSNIEDFANHPKSLAEVRSEKDEDCTLWTPRDVLISLLREIDSGELKTDAMIVSYREVVDKEKKIYKTRFSQSAPDNHIGLGLLSRTTYLLNKD